MSFDIFFLKRFIFVVFFCYYCFFHLFLFLFLVFLKNVLFLPGNFGLLIYLFVIYFLFKNVVLAFAFLGM